MTSLLDLIRQQKSLLELEAEALGSLTSVEALCDAGWSRAIKDDLCGGAVVKSGATSEGWRTKGNAYFQAGKLEPALGCYTEAVLAAPPLSQVQWAKQITKLFLKIIKIARDFLYLDHR